MSSENLVNIVKVDIIFSMKINVGPKNKTRVQAVF
ncbi:MAG: hypothetical protein RL536_576 [Candidatus Parcubacteria bacterium]